MRVVVAGAAVVGAHRHAQRAVTAPVPSDGQRGAAGAPVGGDHDPGPDDLRLTGASRSHPDADHAAGAIVADRRGHRDAVPDVGPELAGAIRQQGVQVRPGAGEPVGGVAGDRRPGHLDRAAAADDPQAQVRLPPDAGVHPELVQHPDGARGEAVTADLLPREDRLLADQHRQPGGGQPGGGRGARGPGPHDQDVDLGRQGARRGHGRTARCSATMPAVRSSHSVRAQPAWPIRAASAGWSGEARIDSAR